MATEYLTIEEFNTHFGIAYSYLNTNKVRLMISAANLGVLDDIYKTTTPANSPKNWQDTWPLYANKGNRTNNVEKDLSDLRKRAEKHLSVIYNDIPASIWSNEDRSTLRRKTGAEKDTTAHEEDISSNCLGLVKKLDGGEMDFKCRTTDDATKASVPAEEGADGVLISYTILPQGTTEGLPISPDDCDKQKVFSGATFRFKPGAAQVGKVLHYYLQWNDSKHPERVGPAGERKSALIA